MKCEYLAQPHSHLFPLFIFLILCLDADLGPLNNVKDAYMKQKHRMLWERRHGKVGTGMKNQDAL